MKNRDAINAMIQRYDIAKAAKVGEQVSCPSCKSKFVKASYQQVFCKTKKGRTCNDKYWNNVTETKRKNTTRISPANAAYMGSAAYEQRQADKQDRYDNYLDDDGSWDAHQCHVERCEWCGYINCRCD